MHPAGGREFAPRLGGDELTLGGSGGDEGDGGSHVVADGCVSIETPTDCESNVSGDPQRCGFS
jgi:hypothetical protein